MELGNHPVALIHDHHIRVQIASKKTHIDAAADSFGIKVLELTLPYPQAVAIFRGIKNAGTDTNGNSLPDIRALGRQGNIPVFSKDRQSKQANSAYNFSLLVRHT